MSVGHLVLGAILAGGGNRGGNNRSSHELAIMNYRIKIQERINRLEDYFLNAKVKKHDILSVDEQLIDSNGVRLKRFKNIKIGDKLLDGNVIDITMWNDGQVVVDIRRYNGEILYTAKVMR